MNDDLQHFTCRNCNADLDTGKAIDGVISCPYCGTPWTLPKRDIAPESARLIYAGYASLDVSKFDEAFTYFSKASELAPKEPEAYFGMALATYQVQYLKDVEKNRLQPICHRFVNKKFRDDVNYQKALSLATYNQGKEYKIRAEQIDEIRKEFLALQAEGIDYDCFICTKVTDEEGKKTEDSTRANDIYFHLLDKGYKPFFSERDLKGRTGANYEAFILYALYMSECMLVVCSREEYLQTKWVKSEYTRFLSMVVGEEKERDALSIVFYRDPIEKLPNGKKIQSIDYSKPDAFQAIDAFVENHTPEATKRRKEEIRDKQKSSESTGSDSYESPRQNHRGSSEKISKIALIGFVVAACIIWIPLTVFAIGNGLGNNEGSSSAGVSWNPIDLNGYTRLCVEDNQGYNPYKLNEDPTDTEIHDHFTVGHFRLYGCSKTKMGQYQVAAEHEFQLKFLVDDDIGNLPFVGDRLSMCVYGDSWSDRVVDTGLNGTKIGCGAYWIRLNFADGKSKEITKYDFLSGKKKGDFIDAVNFTSKDAKELKSVEIVYVWEIRQTLPGWWIFDTERTPNFRHSLVLNFQSGIEDSASTPTTISEDKSGGGSSASSKPSPSVDSSSGGGSSASSKPSPSVDSSSASVPPSSAGSSSASVPPSSAGSSSSAKEEPTIPWNPIDLNGYTRLCVEDNQGYNPYKLNEDPTDTEIHDHFTIGHFRLYGCVKNAEGKYQVANKNDFKLKFLVEDDLDNLPHAGEQSSVILYSDSWKKAVVGTGLNGTQIGYGACWIRFNSVDEESQEVTHYDFLNGKKRNDYIDIANYSFQEFGELETIEIVYVWEIKQTFPGWWFFTSERTPNFRHSLVLDFQGE